MDMSSYGFSFFKTDTPNAQRFANPTIGGSSDSCKSQSRYITPFPLFWHTTSRFCLELWKEHCFQSNCTCSNSFSLCHTCWYWPWTSFSLPPPCSGGQTRQQLAKEVLENRSRHQALKKLVNSWENDKPHLLHSKYLSHVFFEKLKGLPNLKNTSLHHHPIWHTGVGMVDIFWSKTWLEWLWNLWRAWAAHILLDVSWLGTGAPKA